MYVNLLIKDVIIIISVSINMTGCDNVFETITKTFCTNWVGQVLILVSCPKEQVKKYVNV